MPVIHVLSRSTRAGNQNALQITHARVDVAFQDMTAPPAAVVAPASGSFNPNDEKYKSCCCHVKTYTIIMGIIEIFTICFILVAVIPDVSSRMCPGSGGDRPQVVDSGIHMYPSNGTTTTTTPAPTTAFYDGNYTLNGNSSLDDGENILARVTSMICQMNIIWLIYAVLDIVAVNCVFYGIKNIQWLFFIPHLAFRVVTTIVLGGLVAILILSAAQTAVSPYGYVFGSVSMGFICLLSLYTTYAEGRCAHFIKRSQETGYSISIARPIGPATISLSEREAPPQQPARQLPPLRHTYGARERKYADGDGGNEA